MANNRDQLYNDPEEALRTALDGRQAQIWTALPGIVQAVDFTTATCTVQTSINGVVANPDGTFQYVQIKPLIFVPIVFPKGGGFVITLPIAVGDEVLVVIASRCIDSWWQLGGVQNPLEIRMHDLSDGFCIPGPFSKPKAALTPNISATDLQIRNQAGTTYISVTSDGKVKLVSPSEIDLNGTVKVTGNLNVTGAISATAEVTAQSLTTPVTLSTHVHTGVSSGSSNTGPPTG